MSSTSSQTSGASTQAVREALGNLAEASREQLSNAMNMSKPLLDVYKPMFDAYVGVLKAVMPLAPTPQMERCQVPETECPPYCICQISLQASHGEQVHATIRVTNTAKQSRNFSFDSTTFQGSSGDTGVKPTLSPAAAFLNPNQAVTIQVDTNVDDKFQAGSRYDADVKITGLYEQCVHLQITVRPDQTAHCDVKQGEIPTHIRAHHWYDHFQCEEPCFEPATRQGRNEPLTGPSAMQPPP